MDKDSINMIIGVLILVITSYGVYTQSVFAIDIDFFSPDTELRSGKDILYDCSNYECIFSTGKEIKENEKYYMNDIFIVNRGKRTHNVLVDFNCDNIEFYGINTGVNPLFEIKQVYEFSSKIYFPEVDDINFQTWKIIYKIEEGLSKFSCNIDYVSDEIDSGKKELMIKIQ